MIKAETFFQAVKCASDEELRERVEMTRSLYEKGELQ